MFVLSLIDCGVLGLRPQRSGVKDVRCRVNEATLIRFWPPSALTSSSRTPVPWRGDTFDLRLVCRRHVALLLFCFLPQNSTPLATFSSGRLWSCGGGRRRTVKRKKKSNQIKDLCRKKWSSLKQGEGVLGDSRQGGRVGGV